MAEGDASQNQGQQRSGQSNEVKTGVVDQKKLDRAEKERERRRRRRRKKAELKRLERETSLQQGDLPKSQTLPKAEEVPKAGDVEVSKVLPVLQPGKVPEKAKESVSRRPVRPRTPRKKPDLEAVKKEQLPGVAKEPPVVRKSEERVPLSQKIVGGGEQKMHPLVHKTHSFAGPLIVPGSVPEPQKDEKPVPLREENMEPRIEPVQDVALPGEAELQPEVKPEPVPEPQPVQEPEPEVRVPNEPRTEPKSQSETKQEPQAEFKAEPEVSPVREEQIQPVPEPVPGPEPQSPDQPEPQVQHVADYRSGRQSDDHPSVQSEDLVIHNGQEVVRPRVEMREIHTEDVPAELPPVISSPQMEDIDKRDADTVAAEEVEPVKKPSKPVEKEKKVREQHEAEKESVPESEGLGQRKSFGQVAGAFSAGALKSIGQAFHGFRLKFDFKKLIVFVVLMVVGGGLYAGYLFKLHEKAYEYVAGFFKAPPPVEVNIDEQLLKEWGISTALVFGDNRGSTGDLLASQLFNSYYFGFLNEPKLEGETGITPAYFYGMDQDIVVQTNTFIGYVKNLRELVSSYDVDVYKMLDQTTNRDDALKKHLAKLKEIMDKSNKIIAELKIEIDDLKVSYDSLSPDKTRFESDFFIALQGLAGEKSDFLLKSFIDVSQKQTAIKGRFAALQKLAEYYDSSIQKLAIRITSIEKNYQALVQGIRVVDIPGANLDIIIKETP